LVGAAFVTLVGAAFVTLVGAAFVTLVGAEALVVDFGISGGPWAIDFCSKRIALGIVIAIVITVTNRMLYDLLLALFICK
jgi:hypothetical protein